MPQNASFGADAIHALVQALAAGAASAATAAAMTSKGGTSQQQGLDHVVASMESRIATLEASLRQTAAPSSNSIDEDQEADFAKVATSAIDSLQRRCVGAEEALRAMRESTSSLRDDAKSMQQAIDAANADADEAARRAVVARQEASELRRKCAMLEETVAEMQSQQKAESGRAESDAAASQLALK